jgi:sec-independent protein translocase protein TatA
MGLSMGEIVLIIAVILLLFGAEKLPSLARSLGKALKEFKKGLKEGAAEDGDGEKPVKRVKAKTKKKKK